MLEGVGVQDAHVVSGHRQFFHVRVLEEGVGLDVTDLGIGYQRNSLDVTPGLVCHRFRYTCTAVAVDS